MKLIIQLHYASLVQLPTTPLLTLSPVPNYHCNVISAILQMQLNKDMYSLHDRRIFQIYLISISMKILKYANEKMTFISSQKLDAFFHHIQNIDNETEISNVFA